jgi:hypothetical protein
LVAVIFVYKIKVQRWPWDRQVTIDSPTTTPAPSSLESPAESKDARTIVMEDVVENITKIAPEPPASGKYWSVKRFWFVDGSYASFYVEYGEGSVLRRVLLTANLSQMPEISYKVEAYFEPGESDWILKSGKDQTSSLPLILFEYDNGKNQWVQKN